MRAQCAGLQTPRAPARPPDMRHCRSPGLWTVWTRRLTSDSATTDVCMVTGKLSRGMDCDNAGSRIKIQAVSWPHMWLLWHLNSFMTRRLFIIRSRETDDHKTVRSAPCLATPCCVCVSCINNQNSHQSTVSLQRFWISWVVCLSFEILRKKWLLDKILAAFLPGYLITTCTFWKPWWPRKCLRISAESPSQEDRDTEAVDAALYAAYVQI